MRKNIDDRFRIERDGKNFKIEALVRDIVDENFLMEIHTQMTRNKMVLEGQLESIPKQIESLKDQMEKTLPVQIESLKKKMDKMNPFVKEILVKREEEKKKQDAKIEETVEKFEGQEQEKRLSAEEQLNE